MRPTLSMLALGYSELQISTLDITDVQNTLFCLGIQFRTEQINEKYYKIILGRKEYSDFKAKAPQIAQSCTHVKDAGITALLRHIKLRWGAVVGAVFAVVLYIIFSGLVWEVRIEGAEDCDTFMIQSELSALGLHEGAVIGRLDTDAITSEFLMSHPRISWMNITLRGTVATVYCKTSDLPPEENRPHEGVGSNLVAVSDGIVEQLNIKKGRAAVTRGSVVHSGEVLVSGIYQTAFGDFITYAEGEVLAKVTHEYTVTVDFIQTETVYEPDSTVGMSLSIFGRELQLLSHKTEYATSDTKSRVYLLDTVRLPIVFKKVTAYRAFEQTVTLSREQAVSLAQSRLSVLLSSRLASSQLLSKEVRGEFTDTGYTLHCTVTVVENIAKAIEFNIN